MKKTLALLLASILVLSLIGCGSASSTGSDNATMEEKEGSSGSAQTQKSDVSFSQVIVDDDNVKVEITGAKTDSYYYTWNVYLENKTKDVTLMYSMDDVSVNGVMCSPGWSTDVAAGKKANSTVDWDLEEFEENGIDDVTQVEFALSIYNDDDWDEDAYVDKTYTVYPKGKKAAETVKENTSSSDQVLFDTDEAKMVVKGSSTEDGEFILKVYLENKADTTTMFSVDEASINDFMVDPGWATEVAAGKAENSEIEWYEDDLKENNISKVKKIELKIQVYDDENYDEDYYIEKTYTIKL